MYEQFYNLKSKPFSLLPDPEYLYFSKRHSLAYGMLKYGLQDDSGGFAVITGEVGAGKTTLLNKLLTAIDERTTVGLISQTQRNSDELFRWVMMSYKLPYQGMDKVELYERFVEFTEQQYAKGKCCLLIIDEAQNLELEALEELRMLTNVNTDRGQKLKLILSGQPQLLAKLKMPELKQFAQRVAIQYHLDSLNKEEGLEYIRHRLRKAGADADLIDEGASTIVWYYSRGIPRVMNKLCDMSLVYGFAEQRQNINAELVKKVIQDREIGGLFSDSNLDDNNERLLLDALDR